MAIYRGESIRVRARAVDPRSGEPLDPPPARAWVDFYRPGRNPRRDPSERQHPDVAGVAMAYDEASNEFLVFQATDGPLWESGRWQYRVSVEGDAYTNYEFGDFTLRE